MRWCFNVRMSIMLGATVNVMLSVCVPFGNVQTHASSRGPSQQIASGGRAGGERPVNTFTHSPQNFWRHRLNVIALFRLPFQSQRNPPFFWQVTTHWATELPSHLSQNRRSKFRRILLKGADNPGTRNEHIILLDRDDLCYQSSDGSDEFMLHAGILWNLTAGLVYNVTEYLASRGVNIENLETATEEVHNATDFPVVAKPTLPRLFVWFDLILNPVVFFCTSHFRLHRLGPPCSSCRVLLPCHARCLHETLDESWMFCIHRLEWIFNSRIWTRNRQHTIGGEQRFSWLVEFCLFFLLMYLSPFALFPTGNGENQRSNATVFRGTQSLHNVTHFTFGHHRLVLFVMLSMWYAWFGALDFLVLYCIVH